MRPLIIIIFFFACSTESVKLDSTGHSSEIVIVSNASAENNEQIEKLEKLFSSEIYGLTRFEPQFKLLNVEESDFKSIIRRHKKAKITSSHFYVMWNAYIDLESYIITNPHKSMQQIRRDVYDINSEICKNSLYKIQMRTIIDKIMNHKQFDALSPVLVDHRKMRQQLVDSLSSSKEKQTTKKLKNPLLSKSKKTRVNEHDKRPTKICPPGKVLNLKTNRCNKIKPTKTVKRQMLVRKECPPGKARNLRTGRCNKIKPTKTVKRQMLIRKECPPGKARNLQTGRCKIIK